MDYLANEEYLAIKNFGEGLIGCFEKAGNYAAIYTIEVHLELARIKWEAGANQMAAAMGEGK